MPASSNLGGTPHPPPHFCYNSTATTPTSSNEKPFSVYVRLCVNTHTIQNSVSASISAEELAEAGILLVSIIHAADAPREERKPPAISVYLQSPSRDCEGEMPRSPRPGEVTSRRHAVSAVVVDPCHAKHPRQPEARDDGGSKAKKPQKKNPHDFRSDC